MLYITNNINKVIVLKKVDRISIHPSNAKKQLLLPENKVNGINIVLESELYNLSPLLLYFHYIIFIPTSQ